MTVIITFSTVGTDAGPFNLYSNLDGYSSAFALGVTKAQLLAGYPSFAVPNGTTVIRAKSFGACTNFVDLPIIPAPTTTTTSSSSTSTTTTSTSSSTTTTTTTIACIYRNLLEVQISAHFPEVVTLQYIVQGGGGVNQTWPANGSGEEVFHTFAVGLCVQEASVSIDEGTLIANIWNDSVNCCSTSTTTTTTTIAPAVCKLADVTISTEAAEDSDDGTVWLTYMNCSGVNVDLQFSDAGFYAGAVCANISTGEAFFYYKAGIATNASGCDLVLTATDCT